MEGISPITPITPNKRYSCSSEYGTPRGSTDDSDSSLYYSMTGSEDDELLNKENSLISSKMSVIDSPSKACYGKAKTLLRKVLQSNLTPRNENNKRVSFCNTTKASPSPKASAKVAKTQSAYEKAANSPRKLMGLEQKLSSMALKEANVKALYGKTENGSEAAAINDSASDVTDDLDNEMHNTIIENPANFDSTLNANKEQTDAPCSPVDTEQANAPETDAVASDIAMEDAKPSGFINHTKSPSLNKSATKTASEVLQQAAGKLTHTRNAAMLSRQELSIENRKSILPVAKKTTRATTYKRRSSIYEPHKINPRKSLHILKQVASKVTKTLSGNF